MLLKKYELPSGRSCLFAKMRIMASRISLSLMILQLMRLRILICFELNVKDQVFWVATCEALVLPHQSGPYLRNPPQKWGPAQKNSLAQFKKQSILLSCHLRASIVVPPEGSNLVLPTHVLNKNVIAFFGPHFSSISFSSLHFHHKLSVWSKVSARLRSFFMWSLRVLQPLI